MFSSFGETCQVFLPALPRLAAALNASLERQVTGPVNEIERLARLKRFLPGEVADIIMSEGKEALLDSHRCYIACLIADIRRFTSMTVSMEPEVEKWVSARPVGAIPLKGISQPVEVFRIGGLDKTSSAVVLPTSKSANP